MRFREFVGLAIGLALFGCSHGPPSATSWREALDANSAQAYESFLAANPESAHAADARFLHDLALRLDRARAADPGAKLYYAPVIAWSGKDDQLYYRFVDGLELGGIIWTPDVRNDAGEDILSVPGEIGPAETGDAKLYIIDSANGPNVVGLRAAHAVQAPVAERAPSPSDVLP